MKIFSNSIFLGAFGVLAALAVSGRLLAQVSAPAAYPATIQVNLTRTWDPVAPETSPINLLTRPVSDVKQLSAYYDGFGRPLESVSKQTSPLGNDVVGASTYDSWGREVYQYLPFVSNVAQSGDVANDGNFKLNPFQQQAAFYSDANANSPIKGQGETWLYSKVNYENSIQNRVI
ncbi:MAG TPA: DUF6443 domain-containing protein, partial [Puia sp.]|nr:DUF6443 domain-containing protein [Puia sp.]